MCETEAASDPRGGFFGEVRCKVGGRAEASAPTEGLPIGFRRGRCPHRPASVTRSAGKESPSHGFAVTAPFRQGGRGDGRGGLPRALCALAMTLLTRSAECGGTHGSRPTLYLFCRTGPVCPAGGAIQNRRADRGVRSYDIIPVFSPPPSLFSP